MRDAFKVILVLAAIYVAYLIYMRYFYYRMEYSGGSSWPYSWDVLGLKMRCGSYEGFMAGNATNNPDPIGNLVQTTDNAQSVAALQTYLNNAQYGSMIYSKNSAYPKQLPPRR